MNGKTIISMFAAVSALGAITAQAGLISERTGGPVEIGKEAWTNLAEAQGQRTARFWSVSEPTTNATFTLFGSNDGKVWKLVDEEAYQIGWKDGETRYWKCAKPAAYAQYKVTATDFSGKGKIAFKAWGIYDPPASKGAIYHVDAAKGDDARTAAEAVNEATPWKSIGQALKAAKGGDTIVVAGGIYRESLFIGGKNGGTASSPLVLRAKDLKNRPVIDGAEMLDPALWRKTTVTNFRGKKVAALVRELDFVPNGFFAGDRRLVLAHEPAQHDGDSPFEPKYMMEVDPAANAQASRTRLVDAAFLTQTEKDYWKGGSLKFYDGYSNCFDVKEIVAYDPASHALEVKKADAAIGPDQNRQDRWCLCNHLGVLDEPGEYYIDGKTAPVKLYFVPGDIDLKTLSAGRYEFGVLLQAGGVTISGFEFRNQSRCCIASKNGSHFCSPNNRIEDCRVTHAGGSGIGLRNHRACVVARCEAMYNGDNGIGVANMYNSQFLDCTIVRNGNNGFWAGTGTKAWFSDDGIAVRGCTIRDQEGLRQHPDNYQMHQCDNVVITDCTLVQKGHQNGWCQYTGHLVFRNNYLEFGPFGFGAVMYADIAHNVFTNALLRFDAHNEDHRQHGNGYHVRDIRIYGNELLGSGINWPVDKTVDKFQAFQVAGNLYDSKCVHSWDYRGKGVSLSPGAILLAEKPIVETGRKSQAALKLQLSVVWSEPASVIPLWKDAENYYHFSVGNKGKSGLFRRLNGTDTLVAPTKGLDAPHAGRGSVATYSVAVEVRQDALVFSLARGDASPVVITDSDAAALAAFTGALRFGVTASEKARPGWFDFISAEIDSKPCMIDRKMSGWEAVAGKVNLFSLGGCSGIGLGEGSFVGTAADAAKVVSPDGLAVGIVGK